MKLAFLFGPMSTGERPFDFARIEDDPRGLTGTDGSFLGYAKAMSARGHDVSIFACRQRYSTHWVNDIFVEPYEMRRKIDSTWDAALSWNDVSGLADVSPAIVRAVDMQVNDWSYTQPEDHRPIDLYLPCSYALGTRLKAELGAAGKGVWRVLPNGCDPDVYDLSKKVPGRCIFASSPDRGLHLALEQWPRIKAAVPHAELRVFYHSLKEFIGGIARNSVSPQWNDREHARRATVVRDLLPKYEHLGVSVIGSVSRRRMAQEYSEAECLVGPTDTIAFTEGFGVAVLEGLASGAVPCISSVDAFGELYRGACPMVEVEQSYRRFFEREKAEEWSDNVIRTLTDPVWRAEWVEKGRKFAEGYAWEVLGARLEEILVEAKARKAAT